MEQHALNHSELTSEDNHTADALELLLDLPLQNGSSWSSNESHLLLEQVLVHVASALEWSDSLTVQLTNYSHELPNEWQAGNHSHVPSLQLHTQPASDKLYWAIILILLPFLAVFGNSLVILAVCREKSLRSVTNYFIVSLAFADLLVAGVVMPFAVYYLVSLLNCYLSFIKLCS